MSISIIGLGLSYDDLTQKHLSIISNADAIAGGSRHLNYFDEFAGKKIEITKDLKSLVSELETLIAAGKNIVVLASGDPLFYGIGSYLTSIFGHERVTIYANISSVAAAFSKLGESWHDAKVISFHGRPFEYKFINDFKTNDKVSILTDKENTPLKIYEKLEEHHIHDFHFYVFEKLGSEKEFIRFFEPGEKVVGNFSEPNLVILLRKDQEKKKSVRKIFPGMPDDKFIHERGLITKSEVRAVTLTKLMLENDSVLWDLGAGSGSVSIEASFYIKEGHIFAVEKNESRVKDIHQNKHLFGVSNLDVCQGILPEKMDDLPDPDRIFVGGGGKDLESIVERSAQRLLKNGVMVINTVLLKNMALCLQKLEQLNFETEIIQMSVSYGHNMPWDRMLKSQNPVFIIKGIKT